MRTGLVVADIMTRKPVTTPRNLSVRAAAKLMKDTGVGSLLVVEDEQLEGILTKSDIIRDVVAEAREAHSVQVEDIMTQAVITVGPQQDVFEALVLMKENDVRHLPVLEEEVLVGFLTVKDIVKVNPELFEIISESINLREEERKLKLNPYEPQEL